MGYTPCYCRLDGRPRCGLPSSRRAAMSDAILPNLTAIIQTIIQRPDIDDIISSFSVSVSNPSSDANLNIPMRPGYLHFIFTVGNSNVDPVEIYNSGGQKIGTLTWRQCIKNYYPMYVAFYVLPTPSSSPYKIMLENGTTYSNITRFEHGRPYSYLWFMYIRFFD